MKKKILIVLPTLRNGGGVISGLKNMLSLLPTNRFEFYVLPLGYSGYNNVKLENCKILEDSFILTAIDGVYEHSENYKHKVLLWMTKVLLTLLNKFQLRSQLVEMSYKQVAKKYNGYDVVIAYQEGAATQFTQYIKASLRIAWIHCDYAQRFELLKHRSEEHMYSQYDKIVSVSKYTMSNFVQIYPALKKRSTYIYNLLDSQTILQNATKINTNFYFNKDIVNIVSIGRINPIKQFHLIPQIISQILNNGVTNFRWILIGGVDSNALQQINQEIERYNISEKYFIYIGQQLNPYPYIQNSDILVSTSLSEACPYVVNEARVLNVPVVSNNYPSIYEFIIDGKNGRITTIDEMPNVLSNLIKSKETLELLKRGAKTNEYNNRTIIENICALFEIN